MSKWVRQCSYHSLSWRDVSVHERHLEGGRGQHLVWRVCDVLLLPSRPFPSFVLLSQLRSIPFSYYISSSIILLSYLHFLLFPYIFLTSLSFLSPSISSCLFFNWFHSISSHSLRSPFHSLPFLYFSFSVVSEPTLHIHKLPFFSRSSSLFLNFYCWQKIPPHLRHSVLPTPPPSQFSPFTLFSCSPSWRHYGWVNCIS